MELGLIGNTPCVPGDGKGTPGKSTVQVAVHLAGHGLIGDSCPTGVGVCRIRLSKDMRKIARWIEPADRKDCVTLGSGDGIQEHR